MKTVYLWKVIKGPKMPRGFYKYGPEFYFGKKWRIKPTVEMWFGDKRDGAKKACTIGGIQIAVIDNKPCHMRLR